MRLWQAMIPALLLCSSGADAITSGEDEPPPKVDVAQDDYAAGLAAFAAGDWQGVLDHMAKVVEARPWHADAYNRMGFAARRQGDYDRALALYDKALALNPHHRGALEYLGEAYLELDRIDDARATLRRLALECQRVAPAGGDWQSDCVEWRALQASFGSYGDADRQADATD